MIRNNNEIFEKIDKEFIPQLQNTDIENKPFVIAFSGIPGSGKTTIAKRLQERYNAVGIRSDDLRTTLSNLNIKMGEGAEKILNDYTFHLLETPHLENKLIILDSSIDRISKRFFEVCNSNNLEYFIIRINLSGEEAILRILNREKINEEELRGRMKGWVADYKDFGKNAKYDLLVDGRNPDTEKLYQKLDKLLN